MSFLVSDENIDVLRVLFQISKKNKKNAICLNGVNREYDAEWAEVHRFILLLVQAWLSLSDSSYEKLSGWIDFWNQTII